MSPDDLSPDGSGYRGKIERLVDKYDLTNIEQEMRRRRRGETGKVDSLRDLAAFFNRQLLKYHISSTEITTFKEVDTLYEQLMSDEVSNADQTRIRGRLERAGIDIDQLSKEFVSREAVRTYFERHDISPPVDDTDQVKKEGNHIRQLRSRIVEVTKDKLDYLRSTDRITLGEFRVLVDVQVYCEECNSQFSLDDLLDRRGCACAD